MFAILLHLIGADSFLHWVYGWSLVWSTLLSASKLHSLCNAFVCISTSAVTSPFFFFFLWLIPTFIFPQPCIKNSSKDYISLHASQTQVPFKQASTFCQTNIFCFGSVVHASNSNMTTLIKRCVLCGLCQALVQHPIVSFGLEQAH